jgi:hypothetical protein
MTLVDKTCNPRPKTVERSRMMGLLPPVCKILLQAASGRSNGLGTESILVAFTVCITWSI